MNSPIVDAHLDLAYNALRGREVLRPAAEQIADDDGIPTVGVPDLRAGGVGLICATIFAEPSIDGKLGYRTPDEAHAAGRAQLDWYTRRSDEWVFRFVTGADDPAFPPLPVTRERDGVRVFEPARIESSPHPNPLPAYRERGQERGSADTTALPMILLLEGADPIRSPQEVRWWFDQGLRIVALSWKRTRYAGGTGAPGPLTPEGIALVRALDASGMIHDISHLSEESFWQLLDESNGPIMASHSNCRAIVPTDRQLSDGMIRAIAQRGGVIGINFFDKFLLPPAELGRRRAVLADVACHARHLCDVIGDAHHIGLGTDMDGGFGRDRIPQEISTSADLPLVAGALQEAGFTDQEIQGMMGTNWTEFFRRSLPGS